MVGRFKKTGAKGIRICGSRSSSSSSSSLDGGSDYRGVSWQAAEATNTTPRNYGKRAVFEVADGGNDSTSDGCNKKKSRASLDVDAATSARSHPEVSTEFRAERESGRRGVVAAVAAAESEDVGGGGGDNEDGDDFTEIWV